LKFVHRAMGPIPRDFTDGPRSVDTGWTDMLERIRKGAEGRATAPGGKK
jgi:hypothetical protein